MADEQLAKTHGRLTVAEARALMALFDEGVCDKEPVSETVKVVTYRPAISVALLEQYRDVLESELTRTDTDMRRSLDYHDYMEVELLSKHCAAMSCAINLISAEIRRCEP